jgi:hypothetical protein
MKQPAGNVKPGETRQKQNLSISILEVSYFFAPSSFGPSVQGRDRASRRVRPILRTPGQGAIEAQDFILFNGFYPFAEVFDRLNHR